MVPMRSNVCENEACVTEAAPLPHLVLQDVSSDTAPRRRVQRNPLRRVENILLATAVAAVLVFLLINFAFSLFQTVRQSYLPITVPSVVMISKTVTSGDTLTRFANRYGDPNIYILEREEQIARINHLTGTSPLFPGQHLRIPVTNPVVISQIVNKYPRTVLASR